MRAKCHWCWTKTTMRNYSGSWLALKRAYFPIRKTIAFCPRAHRHHGYEKNDFGYRLMMSIGSDVRGQSHPKCDSVGWVLLILHLLPVICIQQDAYLFKFIHSRLQSYEIVRCIFLSPVALTKKAHGEILFIRVYSRSWETFHLPCGQ